MALRTSGIKKGGGMRKQLPVGRGSGRLTRIPKKPGVKRMPVPKAGGGVGGAMGRGKAPGGAGGASGTMGRGKAPGGTGGVGGGGNGADPGETATSGADNTGGGGGSGHGSYPGATNGSGGSGIVVIRYKYQ